jgi:hypothetical protein
VGNGAVQESRRRKQEPFKQYKPSKMVTYTLVEKIAFLTALISGWEKTKKRKPEHRKCRSM